jgi:DNA-directed RNA polymerase specialized sigma24 family protein
MEPASVTGWTAKEMESARVTADFDAVVHEYWPRVFRFALVSLRDRGEAESLTQDCFLKAFQAWRNFRGDCSVNTWLTRIAVNQIRDRARNGRLQFWKRTKTNGKAEWPAGDAPVEVLADGRSSPKQAWPPNSRWMPFGAPRPHCRSSSARCFFCDLWKTWTCWK